MKDKIEVFEYNKRISTTKSIANSATVLSVSKFTVLIISIVIAMLLSRFLTLEEFGTYSQIHLVINIVTTIFLLGLPNSINFFLASAETAKEKQEFLSTYYTLNTILCLITGLFLIILTPLIVSYFNNILIKNFIYVLAVYPWAKIIIASIENVLVIYQKTRHLMFFRFLNSILLLLNILIVYFFNLSFSIFMFLFVIIEFIFSLSVYFIVSNLSGKLKPFIDKFLVIKILKFSIHLGLASVIGTLSIELDKIVIGRVFDTEQLAIYTNAAREMPVTILAVSITAVLMPQLVRLLKNGYNDEAIKLWGSATLLSYIAICYFATVLFVFAPQVITLFYTDKYIAGVPIFRVYCIVLLLRSTYFGIILNSIGKTKYIFYSSMASLFLNLILNYILYLFLGFVGPAIATFISIIIIAILQLIVSSKSINISFKKILPWKTIGLVTVINLIMGLLISYLKNIVPIDIYINELIEFILLCFFWGLIYLLVTLKLIRQQWALLNVKYY